MKNWIIVILLVLGNNIFSQSLDIELPRIINLVKSRSLPVFGTDSTFKNNYFKTGTGVLFGTDNDICVLTCEHVIAIKDSTNKTTRYLSKIYVNVDGPNGNVRTFEMGVAFADEVNDFAILKIKNIEANNIKGMVFGINSLTTCKTISSLSEGDPVLYLGYPMNFGIGKKNSPVSRTGIISQINIQNQIFLIDGFVQRGHSGSPVYKICLTKNIPHKWYIELIGITTSFPKEYGELFERVNYITDSVSVVLNPGFSVVKPMDEILPKLKEFLKK